MWSGSTKSIGLAYSWKAKEKKKKNYIVPYRFSDLFYFEFEGNFSPSISSRGLIFRGGGGSYFWNFTVVKLQPNRDNENERVESCPGFTGNRLKIVHKRVKY